MYTAQYRQNLTKSQVTSSSKDQSITASIAISKESSTKLSPDPVKVTGCIESSTLKLLPGIAPTNCHYRNTIRRLVQLLLNIEKVNYAYAK